MKLYLGGTNREIDGSIPVLQWLRSACSKFFLSAFAMSGKNQSEIEVIIGAVINTSSWS